MYVPTWFLVFICLFALVASAATRRGLSFLVKYLWVGVKAVFLVSCALTPIGIITMIHLKSEGVDRFVRAAFPEFQKVAA
jgi:hypothetical protein